MECPYISGKLALTCQITGTGCLVDDRDGDHCFRRSVFESRSQGVPVLSSPHRKPRAAVEAKQLTWIDAGGGVFFSGMGGGGIPPAAGLMAAPASPVPLCRLELMEAVGSLKDDLRDYLAGVCYAGR